MDGQHVIGIAGVGKMGEALVRGLIVGRVVPPSRILVSDAIPTRAKEVAAKHGVGFAESIAVLAQRADVLVLAAKPKDMAALVEAIGPHVRKDALIITLAAGVRTSCIERVLGGRGRVVRIMPNLACAVGEGATAFALGKTATEHDAVTLEEIFGAIGRVTRVEERMLDAVTGLSGSGPGFIAALAHSMIEGGARSGLPREVAYKLALQTMKGTAELLLIDGLEPMQLFRMVATPNGTTPGPRGGNAAPIARATTAATVGSGAMAKTLDPEPQMPNPAAPPFNAGGRALAYAVRNRARAGSANRSSRHRPASTASPRARARARVAARPTLDTASRRLIRSGKISRISAVLRGKSGIAIARTIRALTDSRERRSGSVEARVMKPPKRAAATLS